MIFKRARSSNEKEQQEIAALKPDHERLLAAEPISALPVADVRRVVDPAGLEFKNTSEIEPISGLIGQDRALRAIQFGADIKSHDFNMFVLGPPASGKTSAVTAYLEETSSSSPPPDVPTR